MIRRWAAQKGLPALALLGGGLGAIGGFMTEPLVVFVGGLAAAAAVFFSQFEQQRLEVKLDAATDEVAKLSRKIVDLATGGDGYCYASIANIGSLIFVNDTDCPLYDVNVRIVDLDIMHSKIDESRRRFGESAFDLVLLQQAERQCPLGNIAPNSAKISGVRIPLDDPKLRWNIFYSARNGFWSQQIIAAQVGEKVEFALRVTRDEITLLEKVPDNFPRNQDGSVNW